MRVKILPYKMKNLFYFFLTLLFISCKSSENGVIIFNANENYKQGY